MSKVANKTIRDPKKLVQNKRELSTDRNVQKINKVTDNSNTSINNVKAKPITKVKQLSKTSTSSRNDTTLNKPSTSRTSLTTNKKNAPVTSKLSPLNKLPSTNAKTTDKIKKSTPSTPPSNRVSKTQYFPSKNMYSNAVKEHMQMKTVSTDEKEQERPRTATLRKGSIVNSNIIGPDVSRSETSSSTSVETGFHDYEDDFESYESDFEEYQSTTTTSSIDSNLTEDSESSSKEERMLDSGNYDMPESKYKLSLTNIREIHEIEQKTNTSSENNLSNMTSLSDEGFEDGKPPIQSCSSFINFAQAQKRIKQNRHFEKQKKRGEELLNMIKLDQYNFTLFEMSPVSYDVFIRSFGTTNAIQTAVQTGEDNISEEIQTDPINTLTKWTQNPVTFSKTDCSNPNYLKIYKDEYVGVGGEMTEDKAVFEQVTDKKYEKRLLNASAIMLNILYESNCNLNEMLERNLREIPFSAGFLSFDTQSYSFLKDKPVTIVTNFSINKILTVHVVKNDCDDSFSKSFICIWNVLNTKEPEKILTAPGLLSSCCSFDDKLVIGGLHDGSLTMWRLGNMRYSSKTEQNEFIFEQPIYMTEINTAHVAKVIAIKQLIIKDANTLFSNNNSNNELCSLDETGVLIIWIIIHKPPAYSDETVMSWNQLCLVQNFKTCLTNSHPGLDNVLCTDMLVSFLETYHIFISTNYGCVLHCLTNSSKTRPKKYLSSISSQINCLVSCPFSPQLFLAGHDDGSISLYSSLHERSLITLSNKHDSGLHSGVEFIQWSYKKPCSFFVKDYSNTIHVWDLKNSDLFPLYSVPFKEKITAMQLSVPKTESSDPSYMILATDNGSVHLHMMDAQNEQFNLNDYERDVKNFFNYVNRL
ncbi:hypothetical protein FQR65_LT01092 [Abscondita terminalis]|nr:hypothetical protein FQR65_LT01092 [Abscondita terminalis]